MKNQFMVRNKSSAFFLGLMLFLGGCASSPLPSATKHGLIKSAAYEPLFVMASKGNVLSVDFKAIAYMFEGDEPGTQVLRNNIVISDRGIHLAEWNIDKVAFDIKFNLWYGDILGVRVDVVANRLLPDLETLVVITKEGRVYKFRIFGASTYEAALLAERRLSPDRVEPAKR